MSEVTLEAIKARQDELADLIAKFAAPAPAAVLHIYRGVEVALRPGERYAGPVLDAEGKVLYHLILMAEKPPEGAMPWKDALAWASSEGGALPTRKEVALLYANCKPHLEGAWHWTADEYESNRDFAWITNFVNGYQGSTHKGNDLLARAVRRFND
jgi:hypothetical protein